MKTRFKILLLMMIISFGGVAQKADSLRKATDSVKQSYLYYALAGMSNNSTDTLFLENDMYFFVNRDDGSLSYKRPDKDPLPVPKAYYNNLFGFMSSFLADDKY